MMDGMLSKDQIETFRKITGTESCNGDANKYIAQKLLQHIDSTAECKHSNIETKLFNQISRQDLDKMYLAGATGMCDGIIFNGGGFVFLQIYQNFISDNKVCDDVEITFCPQCFRIKGCKWLGAENAN